MTRTGTPSSWQLTPSPDQRVLLLLRHAKSDWDVGEADHERPLNRRGRADAEAVGAVLVDHGLVPDLVVCSTATRTRETWDRALTAGARAKEVRYLDEIYAAEVDALVAVVRALPQTARTAMLVGHSPGVPELVNLLGARTAGSAAWAAIDHGYPTAALAVLTFPGPWAEASPARASLVAFEVPRGARN